MIVHVERAFTAEKHWHGRSVGCRHLITAVSLSLEFSPVYAAVLSVVEVVNLSVPVRLKDQIRDRALLCVDRLRPNYSLLGLQKRSQVFKLARTRS